MGERIEDIGMPLSPEACFYLCARVGRMREEEAMSPEEDYVDAA